MAPFALFIALLALESFLGEKAGDTRWLTVLRPFLVAGLLALLWGHYHELHGGLRIAPRHAGLAVATGFVVFAAWIAFDHGWAVVGGEKPGFVPLGNDGRIDLTLAFLRLAGFALVVPLMEELFWRSFMLRWLSAQEFTQVDPAKVGTLAFLLSTALFASEHALWFAGLIAGAAYNLCYMRSRNLWASVLSHAVTNTTLGAFILVTGQWRLW